MARTKRRPSRSGKNSSNREEKVSPVTGENQKDAVAPAETEAPKTNDPEWYAKDPNLLRDAASIPFSLPFGAGLPIGDETLTAQDYGTEESVPHWHDSATLRAYNRSQPGICTLYLKHSIGRSLYFNDPANVAANSLYTFIRRANSGRKNYDPADAFMYMLAFADIYSAVFWAIRLYNYAYMYSQRNYFIGKELIYTNGVNADDIISNLAQFRYELNAFINKVSSFAVPNNIEYFRRRAFLYSNYYLENPYNNIKDQLYQLVPDTMLRFTLDSAGKGCLKDTLFYASVNPELGTYMSMRDVINKLNTMLGELPADEDFGIISGDILKAFEGNIIGLAPIPEEGGLIPVHDPWVLSQFKNAVIANVYRTDQAASATQYFNLPQEAAQSEPYGGVYQTDDGLIICIDRAKFNSSGDRPSTYQTKYLRSNHPLSVENPDPGPGDVIEGTRLMACMVPPTGNEAFKDKTNFCIIGGTELVQKVGCMISDRDTVRTDSRKNYIFDGAVYGVEDTSSPSYVGTFGMNWVLPVVFKYAPTIYYLHADSNAALIDMFISVSNLDNVAIVHREELTRLHETALLSLFYCPGVAKLI